MKQSVPRNPKWLPWLGAVCVWLLTLLPHHSLAQVYYTLNDGGATATTDQLRSIAGASDVLIKDNFVQGAGQVVLDAANNRLLVADVRASQPSTSLTNTKIVAVSLAAGNAVTTLITPTYIAGSASTVVAGIEIDRVNNYLYYTLNDAGATSSTDQLRRVNLDGTGDVLIKDNFVQSAGPLVLDAANNRLLVADTRVSQPSTSLTNTKIVAVSLAAGNAVTTLITPTYIAGSISTAVGDLAIDKTNNYLYYTLNDAGATSSTDQLRRVNLDGTGDVLIKDNFVQSAGPLVLDAANNRLLVADTRVSQPSTSLTNTKIVAVSLAAGNAVTTLITPTYITGSTSTAVAGLAVLEATAPTVTTATPTSTTTTSSVLGGNVTSDGGATTNRGVVYSSTNTTPAIAGSGVTQAANGTGAGTFSATISGLTPATTYYVRAYATNSVGTSYGSVQSFTTPTAVSSIVRANTSPTNLGTVNFTVTFAASVTGLSASNFTLTTTGVTGAAIGAITGSGTTYNVAVTTGTGSGTIRLDLQNSTGVAPTVSNVPYTSGEVYTIDKVAPTVAITSTTGANGSTSSNATFAYTVTFSEAVTGFVAGDVTVGNGTLSGFAGSGTTYTFNVTPAANGAVTVNVPANVAVDPASNGNTAATQYSITYAAPTTTVASITRLIPSPTATTQVSYRVTFAANVSGLPVGDLSLTTTGGISGASVASTSGSGTTYTVVVNTGTGDGTLRLDMVSSAFITPTVTNVPYTTGEVYTITKSFAAAPQLVLRTAGSPTGISDVTAFVDVVQVLSGGLPFAGGLQNTDFETNNVAANSFQYATTVVAAPWSFSGNTGVSRNASGFGSTAAQGNAVGLLQTSGGVGGSIAQNLAVPTGNYQVNFQAVQRSNNGPSDQVVNVFLNNGAGDVFLGAIQPPSNTTYSPFTSATFAVTAPALTATITSTTANGGTTSTSPIAYTVTFSQSVGTTFTASDVVVSNGTLSGFAGSGTTYTFNVTPTANGAVTVNVPANVANDANNTGNTAATQYSITYAQPVTAAPVVIVPSNGSLVNTTTPTYAGTAVAGSTVAVYVDGASIGTTTANGAGNWALTQPTALAQGSHTVYATAQLSGQAVSANSNTNSFTVDSVRPSVAISSATAANGGTSGTTPFAYTVTFSEAVTGFVAGDVTVGNGTLSGFAGSGTTYTFNVTPAANGAVTVNVPANVAVDPASNGNTAASQYSITYNQLVTAAPVVVTPPHVSLTNNNTPTYTGTAPANSTVTLYVDGAFIGTTTATASGTFSFTQPTALTDGTHAVYATAQSSGQAVSANSNANGFTVDTVRPTVAITSTTGANGSTSSNATFAYTVTFSEAVTGFVAGDVTVGNGTLSGFTGSGTTYTFNVTPAANGAVTVNVPANVAVDPASNGNTAATPYSITYAQPAMAVAQNVTVNLAANGTATLNASSVNNGSTGAGTLTYTIQKVVYGQVAEGQTLTLGTPTGETFSAIRFASYGTPTGSNGNYALGGCNAGNSPAVVSGILLGNPSGNIGANNGTFGDPCGGTPKSLAVVAAYSANAAALPYSCANVAGPNYVLLTVTDGNGNTSTMTAQVTVVAPPTASFTLNPASGNAGDLITASGSNLSGATALTVNGASATLSNLTATGFTFVVPAGATLGAGNVVLTTPCSQTPSAPFTVTLVVTAAPVVTAPANGSLVNTRTPTYSGTAPVGSTVTVQVNGLVVGTFLATAGTFSVVQPTNLADGAYSVRATAQLPGQGVSLFSNSNAFTVDATAPTVAINSTAGASGSTTGTSPIPFTVTFSESVTGFVTGDLTVTNGTVSGFSGSGTTYTFTVTPTTAGTATTVNVPANVAVDGAGNGNTAATAPYALTFVAPTITVAPATLPNGTQGTAYSQTLTASGGTAPYTFAITSGALPAGLSLTGSTLSGTPTTSGTFTFRVTATDNAAAPGPYSGFRDYTLTLAAPAVTAVSWTGSVSTDWYTAGNWTPNTVPTATIDATIPAVPSGGRFPAIAAATASVKNLAVSSGATLTQTGGTLDVRGNLTNNGAYQPTGGTVVLGTSTLASVLGSGNTRFWNLTIGANGAQSSTSASTAVQRLFTLNGTFTTNGNPLTLESTAATTALVVNNGSNAIVGTATVQRYIAPDLNPNRGYRHVSAPIGNATVASLATGSFTPVVNPAYNTSATPTAETPFPTVYGYDQARLATTTNNLADFDKGWFSPASLSDALTPGQGYTVNLAANQTWNFVGAPNNGTVTQTLARNSGATAAAAGLQLVGNPYPSPLDWSLVTAADRPNVDGIIYVFLSTDPANPYTGTYGFYQGGFGNTSPVLPLGQGFFVRVAAGQTSGTLSLKNSHRVTSYTNPTYHRTAETRPAVHLTLQGAGKPLTDDAFVYFEAGATDGYDAPYDGLKLANPSGLNLSSSGSAPERLSVNGLAPLGTTQRIVPLAVGVPAAGSYTLNAAEVLNLSTTPVYLRDKQTGAVVDLAQQPSYSFVVSNASALLTSRFELVFSPQAVLATAPAALAAQVGVYPNPATTTTAFVELPAALGRVAVAAELVDALGRTVRTQALPAQGAAAHRLDLANLATGVYTLHLNTSAGVVVKKLVVQQ